MNDHPHHPASYRDPAGFVFEHEGIFYRQVNKVYAAHYRLLQSGGLYTLLVKKKMLLPHSEVNKNFWRDAQWYATLLPEQLPLITYPYEWCFSQWKDAALLTLNVLATAVEHGMILKDATPFNIQFIEGAPVFIDTLSFEAYDASKPWVAYRQFIESFMAPLLLARYNTAALLKTFQVWPAGIPLSVVSGLLPAKSLLNMNIFLHVRLPALLGTGKNKPGSKGTPFTKEKLLRIVANLKSFVQSLRLPVAVTQWSNYYEQTILSDAYAAAKMEVVKRWLNELPVKTVLDLGTNTGLFALAAVSAGKHCIAVDADSACIEQLYQVCRKHNIRALVPLCIDITNPSPGIGWNNAERPAFAARVQTDLTMALALVHHLAIGSNLRFEQLAATFSHFSPWLIIEFVPKNDPRAQLLLQDREDIFATYDEAAFLQAFGQRFTVIEKEVVPGTDRILFLMQRKDNAVKAHS